MNVVSQAALLVTFPVAAGIAGSVTAVVRPPGTRSLSGIQHFAAGVVVAALAGEVLPGLRLEGNLGWAVAGFAAGVSLVLSLAAYGRRSDAAPRLSREQSASSVLTVIPIGFLTTVAIDLLVDGMLVGLGAGLGSRQGLILAIALTLEILFLCLSLVGELNARGIESRTAVLMCSGLSLVTAVGAIGAAVVLGGASAALLAFLLAFGAAALLYLAVEELIVEAHEETETTLLAAMFFTGFLAIYILGELGG